MSEISNIVDEIVNDVNKIYKGKERFALAGKEKNLSDVKMVVPTTSYMLNKILSGGISIGRVYEILGEESTGKSTLGQHIMVGFQQYPGISVLIDAEFTWDRDRATRMGHDSDRHIYLQVKSLEQAIDVSDNLMTRVRMPGKGIHEGCPLCIVWDTVSNSSMEAELDGDPYEGVGMMAKPRKLRELERKWTYKLPEMLCSLVFISQTYTGPSRMPGQPAKKTTSGGGAIKFWASKRLEVHREGNVDYPHKKAGIIVGIKTIKDKIAPPFRQVEVPLLFSTGIHPGYELVNFLLDYDKSKSYLYKDGKDVVLRDYPEVKKERAFTLNELPDVITEDPSIISYLRACVDDIWDRIHD